MNFTVFMPMRTNRMKYVGIVLALLLGTFSGRAADSTGRKLVYTFPIREDIMPSVERLTGKCLAQADEMGADLVVIQMNTYGGVVAAADSIRTMLLNSRIPVWVWIDNQAASAGALIALAADRIYIRPGGNIGAASVVDQQGRPMPDKYQSFMRATMRSTAEAHGKVVERVDGTDTVWRWRRDPAIAEAMVGTTAGDSTTVGVLTLTADEALARHYSEGKAVSVAEVLSNAGVVDYTLHEYNPTTLDRVLGWLMNPFAQGIFIMLIVGGIYFELQTPGVGFPLVAAVLGAVLYFSPLYLEGMVQNWEPILFVVGLLLIAVEIFVLPGFGIAGIAGIVAVVTGLAFAAIDNDVLRHVFSGELSAGRIVRPFLVVIVGSVAAFVAALYFGRRFLTGDSRLRSRIVLTTDLTPEQGYVGHRLPQDGLVGRTGTVTAVLRPSGKIVLDGIYYDAVAENGLFIGRGEKVLVVRVGNGQLYCKQDFSDPSES